MDEKKADGNNGEVNIPKPIRKNLVETAVKFLKSRQVRPSPEEYKRQFLVKKGLIPEEIEEAFKQVAQDDQLVSPHSQQQLASIPPPTPYYHPTQLYHAPTSFWLQIRNALNTVVLICGASYGVYYIYKKHIRAWLFGPEANEESKLLDMMVRLNESVCQLREAVSDLRGVVEEKEQRVATLIQEEVAQAIPSHRIQDLKSEIASVKGLLLARHQFPPTPNVAPSIPAWQLAPDSQKAKETSKNGEVEEETMEDEEDEEEERVVSVGSTNGSSSCEVVVMSSKSENGVGVVEGGAAVGAGGSDTSQGSGDMPE